MTQPVDYEEKARVRVSNSGWNHKNTAGNYRLVCGIISDLLREIDELKGKLARRVKMKSPREVLIKYGQSCYQGFNDPETALSDLSEIVMGFPKKEVNWNNIDSPENIARQSEAYGYNQAITDIASLFTAKEQSK